MKRKSYGAISILAFMVFFFHVSPVTASGAENIEVETLVIPSRNHTRMQPEIFCAFQTSARKMKPLLKMNFVLFNPFQHEVVGEGVRFQKVLMEFMGLLEECVPEVVKIKRARPRTETLFKDIRNHIRKNPKSALTRLQLRIEVLMKDFQFLIIESSDTYGVHPIFYKSCVISVHTPEGANTDDIIEALYGLFFIDAALKQHKLIWGTCHGAQIGYIHAGGKLERLFEYKKYGHDVDFKKSGQKDAREETWHIRNSLNTHKKDTDYFEYGMALYPVPDIFKGKKKQGDVMYMNKDFEHAFGMVEPIPEAIEVISYHPFSEYKRTYPEEICRNGNKAFSNVLESQVLVDAYTYKTMLGTQYHPQYTYDDLETSIVFDYLMRQLILQITDQGKR